jgi:Chitin synthase export chaperone
MLREIRILLAVYLVNCFCEILTAGGILPVHSGALTGLSALHVATATTTFWILLYNITVPFQWFDDGSAVSIGILSISSCLVFIPILYVALDTGFGITGRFSKSQVTPNNNIGLYFLVFLFPLLCLFLALIFLVVLLTKLGEGKPFGMFPRHLNEGYNMDTN